MAIIRECDKIDVGVRERGGKRSVEEMRYKKKLTEKRSENCHNMLRTNGRTSVGTLKISSKGCFAPKKCAQIEYALCTIFQ